MKVTIDIMTGEKTVDADFVAPSFPVEIKPEVVKKAAFVRACVKLGFISGEDAKAFIGNGSLPQIMKLVISKLPEEHQMDAELTAMGSTEFYRSSPLFQLLVTYKIATDEQLDEIFRTAGTLE